MFNHTVICFMRITSCFQLRVVAVYKKEFLTTNELWCAFPMLQYETTINKFIRSSKKKLMFYITYILQANCNLLKVISIW